MGLQAIGLPHCRANAARRHLCSIAHRPVHVDDADVHRGSVRRTGRCLESSRFRSETRGGRPSQEQPARDLCPHGLWLRVRLGAKLLDFLARGAFNRHRIGFMKGPSREAHVIGRYGPARRFTKSPAFSYIELLVPIPLVAVLVAVKPSARQIAAKGKQSLSGVDPKVPGSPDWCFPHSVPGLKRAG
jgi:hypothetical protein